MEALVDNDALVKLARYGLMSEFDRVLRGRGYVPPPRCVPLAKHTLCINDPGLNPKYYPSESVKSDVRAFVLKCDSIKPALDCDPADIGLLASVDKIDDGEGALFAYAHKTPDSLIITGDKRCILALASSTTCSAILDSLKGRIVHLECVLEAIAGLIGWEHVRARICADQYADGGLYAAVQMTHHATTAKSNFGDRIQSLMGDAGGLLHPSF